jgi:peptidoglycan hydrolase-like protein with peptidoglycan-binding domain
MSRRRLTGVVIAVLFIAVIGGVLWLVSSASVTPSQRVADAEPPPPPVVTAQIEERTLSDTVVFRGIVTIPDTQAIMAPDMAGRVPIVVDVPLVAGDEVASGDVVANVSDRPVIVVEMPVPLYRGLTPGIEGEDVARFQRSLGSLGYEAEVTAVFDSATQLVVEAFYQDRGFDVLLAEGAVDPTGGHGIGAANAVVVPLGEVVGISSLPMVISSVDSMVGSPTGGAIVSLTGSDLVIDATVDAMLAALLPPGTAAGAGSRPWLMEVASNDLRDEAGQPIVRLEAIEPLPFDMVGQDVRVAAELAATDGSVLAVPVTAIRSSDGNEILRVDSGDGTFHDVVVVTGVSIGGWVEIIEPDEDLAPGTVVRIG